MKKFLVVSMSAELGGIEKSLINFLNFLEKKDCEIDLLLWKRRGELLPLISQRVNLINDVAPGDLNKIFRERNYRKFFAYIKLKIFTVFNVPWKALKKINKRYDIAISYTQDGYSPNFVIDKVMADNKFLWYHHGSYSKSKCKSKQDNRYYSKFTKIITVSKSNQDMLTKIFSNIENKCIVIKNLIGEEQIIKLSQENCNVFEGFDGCKITTVGRISSEKGQLNSLEVAKELKDKGFKFKWCFVGDGPDMVLCKEKVKALHLEDECIFVGAQVNPYPYIQAADLYVQLSLVEADPVTIQEALVLNKVIVASDIKPISEALEDGKLGEVCKTDENEASSVIMNLYRDSKSQKMYQQNIKNRMARNTLVENLLDELLTM